MRIALATCESPPVPDRDAELVIPALEARGASGELAAWTDPAVDWSAFDRAVISSTWDYHERPGEFRRWLRAAASATRLDNPPDLVEWNLDKRYLRVLEAAGVPVISTIWGAPAEAAGLERAVRRRGWADVIVKPTVDLGAMRLARTTAAEVGDAAARMGDAYLVQPYLPSLESEGELSLVYMGGVLSHTLRKWPAAGDFRVQPQYGGRHGAAEAPAEAVEIGARALAALEGSAALAALDGTSPPAALEGSAALGGSAAPAAPAALDGAPLLYARVDLVRDLDGRFACIELELIEPLLYLDVAEGSAERLADLLVAGV